LVRSIYDTFSTRVLIGIPVGAAVK